MQYLISENVFSIGSPLDDEIVMGEDKSCVVKNDGGNNKYVIYISNEHHFTHTIIDDSNTLGEIYLVGRTGVGTAARYFKMDLYDMGYDEESQTIVTFMRDRNRRHTFTGRIIIKRTKPGDVKGMKLYLVRPKNIFGCKQVASLDKEGVDCSWEYTLGHDSINRGIGSKHRYNSIYGWNIDDRPVPSVPFRYNLDTDLEADPILGLCGDFIIALKGDHPFRKNLQYSLRLPTNSFIAISDQFMADLKDLYYLLYYMKSEKKLVFEHRYGPLTEAAYTIKVHVPEAKRIVYGTVGSYRLLLDLKHDDRPAVNFASECFGLDSRSVEEYKFTENYADENDWKPNQLVLGVPSKTPTESTKCIEFSKAKTYGRKVLDERPWEGDDTTGDYAENALIVGYSLWTHLSSEDNDMKIEFEPIKVSKKKKDRPNKKEGLTSEERKDRQSKETESEPFKREKYKPSKKNRDASPKEKNVRPSKKREDRPSGRKRKGLSKKKKDEPTAQCVNGENMWQITVKKTSSGEITHQVRVKGASTLAYREGLVRSNLYDLVNGEKEKFDLYEVWKQKMDSLEGDIEKEANRCR